MTGVEVESYLLRGLDARWMRGDKPGLQAAGATGRSTVTLFRRQVQAVAAQGRAVGRDTVRESARALKNIQQN